MDRSVKIILGISAALLVVFIGVISYDYVQFQSYIDEIAISLNSAAPCKLQAAWFTVVVVRSVEFLVPSLLFGFWGFLTHFKDRQRPKAKKAR